MPDKDEELILGLPRATIVEVEGWRGIKATGVEAVIDLITNEGEYRPRGEAEDDPTWKQIIPYLLMRDRDRVFLMRRSKAGGDARLHDRYSLGIGGHLNPEDGGVLPGLAREFHEEMTADWDPEARLVGLLNDDSTSVGRVHLGVVFEADAQGRTLTVRETDKLEGEFVDIAAVAPIYDRLETWSQVLYDHVAGATNQSPQVGRSRSVG